MPWISIQGKSEEDIRATLKELEHDFDRAAGIAGAVLVEDHLTIFLQTRLDPHVDLIQETFRASGPLGPFGTKINFGLLMGLYSNAAWKELDTIKKDQK